MIRSDIRAYINIGALVLVLLFNFLSNALPFNGLTQGDLAELYPVLLTPATYVFSIWGLIYIALIAFIIYQAMPGSRDNPLVKAVGILFALSSLFNILWLFAWHYQRIGWSMIIMLLLLASLIVIYLRIGAVTTEKSIYERFLVKYPFSLYLGWISAATLVNFNVLLYDIGWLGTGGGGIFFTMLMILVAGLVALAVFYLRQDYVYAAVFVWALVGIGVRHGTDIIILTIVAWLAAAAILFFLGWITARQSRGYPEQF
ncbi:MAG: TspO/MBR family protein [Dethiobacteria bacterium]|nr:tryptophan-rich sensory protein [Bacillota bacterium]MDW7729569.1 TspO/MBR family protein [Bacillota bacterium]